MFQHVLRGPERQCESAYPVKARIESMPMIPSNARVTSQGETHQRRKPQTFVNFAYQKHSLARSATLGRSQNVAFVICAVSSQCDHGSVLVS